MIEILDTGTQQHADYETSTLHPTTINHSSSLPLILHPIRIVRRVLTDPENIVTSYKHLPERPLVFPILPFLRIRKFNVHITVHRRKSPMILHPPLEFDNDMFARQVLKERFRIYLMISHFKPGFLGRELTGIKDAMMVNRK